MVNVIFYCFTFMANIKTYVNIFPMSCIMYKKFPIKVGDLKAL